MDPIVKFENGAAIVSERDNYTAGEVYAGVPVLVEIIKRSAMIHASKTREIMGLKEKVKELEDALADCEHALKLEGLI